MGTIADSQGQLRALALRAAGLCPSCLAVHPVFRSTSCSTTEQYARDSPWRHFTEFPHGMPPWNVQREASVG